MFNKKYIEILFYIFIYLNYKDSVFGTQYYFYLHIYKTTHNLSSFFSNVITSIINIKKSTYYENVVYYVSKTGAYISKSDEPIVKKLNNSIDYEPVMLVRTRSNSICSNPQNDDDYDYDITPVSTNSHLAQYLNRYETYEYSEWMQYGILPSPKKFDTLSEYLCSLCGKEDENALHHNYYSGCTHESEKMGFNVCCLCKFKFDLVIKKRAELIWDLLDNKNIKYFWAPRTRRDPVTNQRIYSGPYSYEKWRAVSNYVSYMTDVTKGYPSKENTPFIFCSLEQSVGNVSKLIPVVDILKSNYIACRYGIYDTAYDPNIHDPINTLELSPDDKINLRY